MQLTAPVDLLLDVEPISQFCRVHNLLLLLQPLILLSPSTLTADRNIVEKSEMNLELASPQLAACRAPEFASRLSLLVALDSGSAFTFTADRNVVATTDLAVSTTEDVDSNLSLTISGL